MKCQKCGFENDDKNCFCKKCGTRIGGKSSGFLDFNIDDKFTTNDYSSDEKSQANKSSATEKTSKVKSAGLWSIECLKKAWGEIQSDAQWVKKICLVGLCNIVPILNFGVSGYTMNWGVKAAKGNTEKLESGIFNNGSMLIGFFEFLTFIVYGIIFALASQLVNSMIGWIFIVGPILFIAIFLFQFVYDSFVSLACMKTAIDNNLGSSFSFSEIWKAFKADWRQMILIYFLPRLICKLISIAFMLLVFGIGAASKFGSIVSLVTNYQSLFSNINVFTNALALVSSIFFVAVFAFAGYAFIEGVEKLVRYRAIGHYINKNAKNWL